MESAEKSLISYIKHIEPGFEKTKLRFRFDINKRPEVLQHYNRTFFGCGLSEDLLELTSQYKEYINVYFTRI